LPLFSRRASQIRILSRHSRFLAFALTGIWCSILLLPSGVRAQLRLLPEDQYHQIRDNASGELPFLDFARLIRFSGFAPSKGADEIAGALSAEATADGPRNSLMWVEGPLLPITRVARSQAK
jgi:hypothetical protein